MPILEDITFSIDKSEVLKSLSFFPHKSKLDPDIERQINAAIDEAQILAHPKAVYETFDVVKIENGYELIGTGYRLTQAILLKHLKSIERVTLFVCTIGHGLEDHAKKLQSSGELTRAAILDAVAGEAVEGVANQVNEIVKREANLKKYKLRRRFSPGYGDWGIEEQPAVLRLTAAAQIGVSLTSAHVMVPEKSISALIGWHT